MSFSPNVALKTLVNHLRYFLVTNCKELGRKVLEWFSVSGSISGEHR